MRAAAVSRKLASVCETVFVLVLDVLFLLMICTSAFSCLGALRMNKSALVEITPGFMSAQECLQIQTEVCDTCDLRLRRQTMLL